MDDLMYNPKEVEKILHTPEGLERLSKSAGQYIRNKMYYECIADVVMPPQRVTDDELHPIATTGQEAKDEGLNVAVFRDMKNSERAMIMEDGNAKFTQGYRYAIPLADMTTDTYGRTEGELIACNWDLLDIIDETVFRQAMLGKDEKFLAYCNMAVSASGQSIVLHGDPTERSFLNVRHPNPDGDLPAMALMSLGACTKQVREACEEHDIKIIKSIKTKLFDTWNDRCIEESVIWLFSEPDMLGDNLLYDDYQIWARWEGEVLKFYGWEKVGLGIKDIHAITKIKVMY